MRLEQTGTSHRLILWPQRVSGIKQLQPLFNQLSSLRCESVPLGSFSANIYLCINFNLGIKLIIRAIDSVAEGSLESIPIDIGGTKGDMVRKIIKFMEWSNFFSLTQGRERVLGGEGVCHEVPKSGPEESRQKEKECNKAENLIEWNWHLRVGHDGRERLISNAISDHLNTALPSREIHI